ncbi:MAG: serine hydrolase [Synergistaceae bacterium]|nr:serine hydrolase [Synergistaceae bacterium]MDD4541656.1 serine hydrolase [Eubacteriales bacterium]
MNKSPLKICSYASLLLALIISFIFFSTTAVAQEKALPSGVPDSEIAELIDTHIEEHKDTTAAVSIAVFRDQDTIYKTDYGYANIEKQLPADNETVYEWGSASKLLVWVSVMQLWEQGKIDLEADIREYLPENFFTKLKYDQAITMTNLMNHNAGWEDSVFHSVAKDADSLKSLEAALKATEPQQVYEPGKVVSYSNWGAALAGYIVELISGQPFYDYVQENIFQALGMKNSSVSPDYADNPQLASKLSENQGYTTGLLPLHEGFLYLNLYPAGSAAGTLEDFLCFAKALLPDSDGAAKLFHKADTADEMFSPTLTYPDTDIDYVNHGFWSSEYNVQALGHAGNTLMYSSHLLLDPVSGTGIVIMTNQSAETVYNYGLPPLIFGETGQLYKSDEKADVSEISGLYYSARTIHNGIGKMYTLLGLETLSGSGDGNLHSSLFGLAKTKLNQIAENTFLRTQQIEDIELKFLTRFSNLDDKKMMSTAYGDSPEADAGIWLLVIVVILFILALLWSAIVLITSFIKLIYYRIKKKGAAYGAFKKHQIIVSLAIILL